MSSPAERFAAARVRRERETSPLGRFVASLEFEPDDFQTEAMQAVADGHGVLVAAPTGAGKTVVGEFAVDLAVRTGRKAFYTTPIKALSNQKYADLVAVHGADAVGLLTGDVSVNGEAPVVVMTTEVLRNMIYAGSPTLAGLGFVVMDEVHYLADRFRGAVWEEVIIHLAEDVQLVSLSATVSNAEEFGEWLATVRGDTRVVVSEHRPVPLWQHVLVDTRLHDLFVDPDGDPVLGLPGEAPGIVNPELVALAREDSRFERRYKGRPQRGGTRPRKRGTPSRAGVVEALDKDGLLPAIHFIFSRNGCDAAVRQCLAWGVRLTTPGERAEIRRVAEERTAALPDADLGVLGWSEWVEALERGLAAHHAGLLPAFKETVEELFRRGLVKMVFATETLALGVNMPARSVVLEKLVKWNGEQHVDVTAGEYTQLTGRAGRRGIDVEGHAVVLWSEGLQPDHVAGLASTRTYPLRSSFAPTYSMAVNLVAQVGREGARSVLELSFAQFQADRGVVGLARQVRKQEEALAGYTEAMACHLGDFESYHRLRTRISTTEKQLSKRAGIDRRADAAATLERLRRGDVIDVPTGKQRGWAVVLDPGLHADGPRPTVLTADRQVRRLDPVLFPAAVQVVATIKVPKHFDAHDTKARRDLTSSMRNALAAVGGGTVAPPQRRRGTGDEGVTGPGELELVRLRRELRAHPCHGCADREDHARWAQRRDELERDHRSLQRKISGRTAVIARTFDRVCEVLDELGYLDGEQLTPAGERLRFVYTQSDLLVAECLRTGIWEGLDGPSLAAVVSTLVFEARREVEGVDPRLPGRGTAEAWTDTVRAWSALTDLEADHRVPPTREPDPGFAAPVWRWAQGQPLETVLRESDLSPGDFVRWCRQTLDLLDQVQASAERGSPLRAAAGDAIARVRRGVVEYSLGATSPA
ncbi:DEAD/DEAH box helicase [Aquipuribacter hungaricus]|uniref:DEAD/DEAH box helicase n=1 Tax=Aquipuribacter hungaricus TaxID=545624 RepID=A0ABV7WCW1_9MICO